MDSLNKELLYVAYNFPPFIGAGVARTEQNSQALLKYGWQPTLLVATAENSEEVDKKYAQMGIKVLRASSVINEGKVRCLPRGTGTDKESFCTKLKRTFAKWALIPERQVLWKLPAQQLAIKSSHQHKWKCVFSTSPPLTAGWIGMNIANRLKLPFVLEFRDIISDDFEGGPPTAMHREIARKIERKVVHSASKIIAVSPGIKDWVMDRHKIKSELIEVIPSGYDPKDKESFDALPTTPNDRFTMIYAGAFYRHRKPDTLLKAVKNLIDRGLVPANKLKVVFVSNLMPSVISQYQLDNVVETFAMMPREKVLHLYANSDLLLLICDKCDYQNVTIPGKIFEYIMTEKPILGLLGLDSVTAQIMKELNNSAIADAEDVEGTTQQLLLLYKQWESGKVVTHGKEILEKFNCYGLVKRLALVFDEVCSGNKLN
ncbi:MAG: hypothetical protein A2Y13_11570 [Planctomycetes bacterium GWC2_45_44]|nr:MAG: hypothetical protein A2Y13_11570 [Planctomycetes bacterium GWC2_45_44]